MTSPEIFKLNLLCPLPGLHGLTVAAVTQWPSNPQPSTLLTCGVDVDLFTTAITTTTTTTTTTTRVGRFKSGWF